MLWFFPSFLSSFIHSYLLLNLKFIDFLFVCVTVFINLDGLSFSSLFSFFIFSSIHTPLPLSPLRPLPLSLNHSLPHFHLHSLLISQDCSLSHSHVHSPVPPPLPPSDTWFIPPPLLHLPWHLQHILISSTPLAAYPLSFPLFLSLFFTDYRISFPLFISRIYCSSSLIPSISVYSFSFPFSLWCLGSVSEWINTLWECLRIIEVELWHKLHIASVPPPKRIPSPFTWLDNIG